MKAEYLLEAGFIKDNDPMFPFRKELIDEQTAIELGLHDDDIPCLLFGDSGVNRGFCIYTGEHFIFFNASSPKEAIEFAEKVTAFEPV